MKRVLLVLLATAGLGMLCPAQDFIAPAGRQRTIVREIEPQGASVEGMVKEIFTRKPWQAVNPLAPKAYGSGERLVSKDSGPGTPVHASTLTVVGVEW
jgi:hypothetical protein